MGINVEFDYTYYEGEQVETDLSSTTKWDDMLEEDEIAGWESAFMQGWDEANI